MKTTHKLFDGQIETTVNGTHMINGVIYIPITNDCPCLCHVHMGHDTPPRATHLACTDMHNITDITTCPLCDSCMGMDKRGELV